MKQALLCSLLVGVALGAETFVCPLEESTGKFADPDRCDKYWDCFRGEAIAVLCEDGYAFDPSRIQLKEPCDYIFNVDCRGREKLGKPKGSGECERLNGLYPVQDPNDCDHYVSCERGVATTRSCGASLHFNIDSRTCDWPQHANRGSCDTLRTLAGVTCDPKKKYFTKTKQMIVHPTFAHPEDCELFISCLNGVVPSIARCDAGLVFSEQTGACEDPSLVPECYDGPVYDASAPLS